MICFSLTSPTLQYMTHDIDKYEAYIDLVELRADLLENVSALAGGVEKVREFANACVVWAREEKVRRDIQCIFTLRTKADGGTCEEAWETARREALEYIIASNVFEYVDVEAEHEAFCTHMYECAEHAEKTRLIVSRHWFDEMKAFYAEGSEHKEGRHDYKAMPWLYDMKGLGARYPHAIVKQAVMCASAWDLEALFLGCEQLGAMMQGRYVLAPMGDFGRPARVLTAHTKSLWTYASAHGSRQAACGHFDPKVLCETYAYKRINQNTRVFAVVGNPVMHSRSPQFHNAIFQKQGLNAVYVHMPLEDINALPPLMRHMNIHGLSVTIPHKGAVIPLLDNLDDAVRRCRSCNTVMVQTTGEGQKICGHNTDVVGFLRPLIAQLEKLGKQLVGMTCTVVGSGGTARAISHALLGEYARLLVVNRTVHKAQELALFLSTHYGVEVAHAEITDYKAIKNHDELIVQTTSVGMNAPNDTALPKYQFHGNEIAYDVVYTPPRTKFLQDAETAGCTTISGEQMFIAQAQAQSELFCKTAHT